MGQERLEVAMGQVGVLDQGEEIRLEAAANEEVRFLLIAGEPIREPIARHGPFVMNTWEEIEQAFRDYRSGKLGRIEGAEQRYATTQAAVKKQKESGTWSNSGL